MQVGMSFLFACIAIAISLEANAAPAPSDCPKIDAPTMDFGVWRHSLRLSHAKNWQPKMKCMYIAPTSAAGAFYVPFDLSDAWRELDNMLPNSYSETMASHATGERCEGLEELPEHILDLHGALAQFVVESWFWPKDSRFWYFTSQLAKTNPPESFSQANAMEFQRTIQGSFSGTILCAYYKWKRTDNFEDLDVLQARFNAGVRQANELWRDVN